MIHPICAVIVLWSDSTKACRRAHQCLGWPVWRGCSILMWIQWCSCQPWGIVQQSGTGRLAENSNERYVKIIYFIEIVTHLHSHIHSITHSHMQTSCNCLYIFVVIFSCSKHYVWTIFMNCQWMSTSNFRVNWNHYMLVHRHSVILIFACVSSISCISFCRCQSTANLHAYCPDDTVHRWI